jgi:hypothetical protein
VDTHTRAVFTEFTLYNANVNLFASVIMLVEWMASGSAVSRAEVKVGRDFMVKIQNRMDDTNDNLSSNYNTA